MLVLHDNLTSGNGYKARLLLAQLGIVYRRIEYDIDRRETRTPEFLAKNLNGRIPVLELEDGSFLPESNAILWYLAEGTQLLPADRRQRAEVLRWMFFEQNHHEPNVAGLRFWIMHAVPVTPLMELWAPTRRASGDAALAVMDGHLAARSFFVGERYSIADIALYAYTHVAHEGGFDLAPYVHIGAWLGRVAAQPGYIPITQG
jgi:glutathione S-transferase